jgi:prophage DNA circulation protein
MSYIDRLLPAAYVSPSGTRIELRYSDGFEKTFEHKLGRFEFSQQKGTYFQDNDITSDVFPCRFHLAGPDYDLDADEFETLLKEKVTDTYGILEHPIYGSKNVVVSTVRRGDDPQNKGGIGVFDVLFYESITLQPEETQEFNADQSDQLKDATNQTSAEGFENNLDIDNSTKEFTARELYTSALGKLNDAMSFIANKQNQISIAFTQGLGDILNTLDTLIRDPLNLALQTQFILQLPVLATDSFLDRFDAYNELLNNVLQISGDDTSILESKEIDNTLTNEIGIAEVFGVATVSAMINTATLSEYTTRSEALAVIQSLLTAFNTLTDILDRLMERYASLIFFEQYFSQTESFNSLRTYLMSVIADIQKRSLSLAIEKTFTLTEDKHYLQICSDEYNDISEDTLSFFESTNNIIGDEFFLLPKGREVVVYI